MGEAKRWMTFKRLMAIHEVHIDDLVLFDSIEKAVKAPLTWKTLDNNDLHQVVASSGLNENK